MRSARRRKSLEPWLQQVARYAAANWRRVEQRRRRHERAAALPDRASPPDSSQPDVAEAVTAALRTLHRRDRRLIFLRHVQEAPWTQVASALRMTPEAARKATARAMQRLREALTAAGIPASPAMVAGTLAALGIAGSTGAVSASAGVASAGAGGTSAAELATGAIAMMKAKFAAVMTLLITTTAALGTAGAVAVNVEPSGVPSSSVQVQTESKQNQPRLDRPRAQDGVSLRDEVQSLLRLNFTAIESIEADYTFSFEGNDVQARMAQKGDKQYHASALTAPNGGLLPAESAWDGSKSYMRRRFGRMTISRDSSRYMVSAPLPHDLVAGRVLDALGVETPNRPAPVDVLDFVEARAGRDPDQVILVHRSRRTGEVMTSVHSRRMNGFPTSVELTDAQNRPVGSTSEVRYESTETEGNTIWYPVLVRGKFRQTIFAPGEPRPEAPELKDFHLRVDLRTLRINHDIDDAHFELIPWPSEDVYDETTQRMTPAANPSWQPAGNVAFPFEEFAAKLAQSTVGVTRSGADLGRAAPPPPQLGDMPVQVVAAANRRGWFRYWHVLLAGGMALLAGAGVIAYRHRKQAAETMSGSLPGRRRAFTLVELLVVIGIIAVLLSLLLPALASARRKSIVTSCAATMRSHGQAVSLFANDNRGRLYPMNSELRLGPHRGTRLALLYADDDYRPELLLCGTADDNEQLSYLFNGWTAYDRVKLHDVGISTTYHQEDLVAPSDAVLLGESARGTNVELSDFAPALPGRPFLIFYDDRRHEELGANRLWLDLHVSRDLPRGTPYHVDPWWVPGN